MSRDGYLDMARLAILLAILLIGALALWWFSPKPLSPEARVALEEWLNTSCQAGENNSGAGSLRRFSAALEAPLIEIAETGPPQAALLSVENQARRRYEQIRVALRSGKPTGLPAEYMAKLAAQPVDDYVLRSRQDYVAGQVSAALAGLGIIGGGKGRRLLEQIAADPKSPFQETAREARFGDSAPGKL